MLARLFRSSVPPRWTGLMWSTLVAVMVQRGPRMTHWWLSRARARARCFFQWVVLVRPADAVRGLVFHPQCCGHRRVPAGTRVRQPAWLQYLGARALWVASCWWGDGPPRTHQSGRAVVACPVLRGGDAH